MQEMSSIKPGANQGNDRVPVELVDWHAGLIFAGMAVISLVGVMPAAHVADHLGRKWTIVPSSLGLAAALLLMATTGFPSPSSPTFSAASAVSCP